ncbi:MAG: hypothetical protein ACK5V3_12155, partial [Bdellovibrionales bacterium]
RQQIRLPHQYYNLTFSSKPLSVENLQKSQCTLGASRHAIKQYLAIGYSYNRRELAKTPLLAACACRNLAKSGYF